MTIHHISAVTLAVEDMARSVAFYQQLGLESVYGGGDASFTSFKAGSAYLNLMHSEAEPTGRWGRVILRVENADAFHRDLAEKGLSPEPPRDGSWGERYFHIQDPDGHELSFAQLLAS